MMSKQNLREARKAKKRKQKLVSILLWGSITLVVVGLFGYIIWRAVRPPEGEAFAMMANAGDHVPEGVDPGPFNSDPPTSGQHYGQPLEAGFYDESSQEIQSPYPEGYLLHNLEHGYVIYWYNCDLLDEAGCVELKAQIRESMAKNGNTKLIAFPRTSMEMPVALTSWGQMLPLEDLNQEQAKGFVSANRNRAPEPNAP
jgi:hypothetical protein